MDREPLEKLPVGQLSERSRFKQRLNVLSERMLPRCHVIDLSIALLDMG